MSFDLRNMQMEEPKFIELLSQLIGLTEKLQNNPPDLVPQEELAADVLVNYLSEVSGDKGPLEVRKVTYVDGRSNVIVKYPASAEEHKETDVVSFVGMHLDVVPANAEEWDRSPFKLQVDDDGKLWGRGVTDCLGHVALLTEFLRQLGLNKPKLRRDVICVFIANEEASATAGIGVDELERRGELEVLKPGPLFWIDSADFGPTLGTGGVVAWRITIEGKKFHSGVPQNGINAIALASEVVRHLQARFYEDFQVHAEKEKKYNFNVGSSMKPTQIATPPGSLNQIPGTCTVSGDIRFTPFYDPEFVTATVERYVAELDVTKLETFGASRFELPDEGLKGIVKLEWLGAPYPGIACNIETDGHKALHTAVDTVRGAKPFSLTGSLPVVRELQTAGFDVQITGFGRMSAYHANNEFAYLSDYKDGIKIAGQIVANLE